MPAAELISPAADALASAWEEARQIWLEQQTINTRRAYESSLRMLLEFSSMEIWQIGRKEVARWAAQLRKTCADATLAQRLSAVSSFYKFCAEEYTLTAPDGSEVPLSASNPALGAARPHIDPYNKAAVLDLAAAKAFLAAIPRARAIDLRDYALFLGFLMTGRRNSEWRNLRYEDIEIRAAGMIFRWSGKGRTNAVQELPAVVWDAIEHYAELEGRSSGYVFHSYDWHGAIVERPISAGAVRASMKYYANKAGLNGDILHVHSLRHTAALLRKEAGDDLENIRDFLGHMSLGTTSIYLRQLQGRKDDTWQTVAQMLGL